MFIDNFQEISLAYVSTFPQCSHQLSAILTVEMVCQTSVQGVIARRKRPTNRKQHPLTLCKPGRKEKKIVTHIQQLSPWHSRLFGTRQKHFVKSSENMTPTIILKKSSTVLTLRLQRGRCHDGMPSSASSWTVTIKVFLNLYLQIQ